MESIRIAHETRHGIAPRIQRDVVARLFLVPVFPRHELDQEALRAGFLLLVEPDVEARYRIAEDSWIGTGIACPSGPVELIKGKLPARASLAGIGFARASYAALASRVSNSYNFI